MWTLQLVNQQNANFFVVVLATKKEKPHTHKYGRFFSKACNEVISQ